jgi:hypothetical protein
MGQVSLALDLGFRNSSNRVRHCAHLGEDPLQFLVKAQKEDVMLFLEWMLDNSNIKKFSALHENWRLWCQLYRKAVGNEG